MMAALEAVRTALAALPGVTTCKIGMEDSISPADYPLIRIVPGRITPGRPYNNREVELSLYFGTPIANSAGLEAVYSALFALEADIIAAVRVMGGRYLETITDEDRLPMYKLMVVRAQITAENPTA